MEGIDQRFAFFTDRHQRHFQVLIYDDEGNPTDWDEKASAEAMNNAPAPPTLIQKFFGNN